MEIKPHFYIRDTDLETFKNILINEECYLHIIDMNYVSQPPIDLPMVKMIRVKFDNPRYITEAIYFLNNHIKLYKKEGF